MATVDSLQIEIKASAQNAEKALDSLIDKLSTLSTTLDKVDSAKLSKSTGQLSNNFKKFSLKISKVSSSSKSLSQNMNRTSNSFNKTHSSLKGISSAFDKFSKSAKSTENIFEKFARTVGKLQNEFWILKRVVGAVGKSIKSAMDFIETENYFDRAFEQVSSNAISNWAQSGYESAEAYANSFKDRATELTKKMSGFSLVNGALTPTGTKSLGLDPNELMKYQAQFAQMSSSMGVASENALALSNALTMIGADLASVRNMDFDEVWGNMASGLTGMSRTLDKYGINIRNANMQQKLYELGIDATVASLSQADKALLRTIIILDSSKYAWGDLSKTIEMPANQLRILSANFQNLCRMLGGLFLPLVKAILPWVNALVVALQRLVMAIGKFFGIDMSQFSSSQGGGSEGLSDILDQSEELGDQLDEDADSAKKLKNNLLGVDELNVLSDDKADDSGKNKLPSGLLDDAFMDALGDYQDAWNKAFDAMQDKIKELADKIVEFFKKLWSPIAKAWEEVGDKVVEAWKKAFNSLKDLLKGIGEDFMKVWLQPETVEIFKDLFLILADIGEIVSALADNFLKAWKTNDVGLHILENIRDIIGDFVRNIREFFDYAVEWARNLDFYPLLESIEKLTRAIADDAYDLFGIIQDLAKEFLEFAEYVIEDFAPKFLDIFTKIFKLVDTEKLRKNFAVIWDALEKIAESAGNGLLVILDKLADVVINFLNGDYLKRLGEELQTLADSLSKAKNINDVFEALFTFGEGRMKSIADTINFVTKSIDKFVNELDGAKIGKGIGGLINSFFENWDASSTGKMINDLALKILEIIKKALAEVKWKEVGEKIGDFLKEIHLVTILWELFKTALTGLWGLVKANASSFIKDPFGTIIMDAILGISLAGLGAKFAEKLKNSLFGSGLTAVSSMFKKIFGSKEVADSVDELGKEGKALEKIAKGAELASGKKDLFTDSNMKLADKTKDSIEDLTKEGTTLGKVGTSAETASVSIGGIIKIIGGITLVAGGGFLAIKEFVDQLSDGFSWAKEGLMLLGVALAGVGAYLLGAPALVVAVVGAIVATVATAVVVIKEHWTEIKEWFSGLGDWLGEHIGKPVKEFFTEKIPEALKNCKEKVGEFVENTKIKFGDWVNETSTSIKNWARNTYDNFMSWYKDTKDTISKWYTDTTSQIVAWGKETVNSLKTWYRDATDAIKNWFGETKNKFDNWKQEVSGIVERWATETKDKFNNWRTNVESTISQWSETIKSKIEDFKETTKAKFDEWSNAVKNKVEEWKNTVTSKIEEFKETTKAKFEEWKNTVQNKFEEWSNTVKQKVETWKTAVISKVEEFKTKTETAFNTWKQSTEKRFEEWKNSVTEKVETFKKKATEAIENFKTKAIEKINEFKEKTQKSISEFAENAEKRIDTWKNNLSKIFEETKNNAINKFKEITEGAREWFSAHNWTFDGIATGLRNAFDKAMSVGKEKLQTMQSWISSFNMNVSTSWDVMSGRSYSTFATGGFPEDGWFRASHGELIGKFDNGQSVVANNQQITEGIRNAVYDAMMSANNNNREEQLLEELISAVKRGQKISIDGREIVTAYDNRKTRNGFAF